MSDENRCRWILAAIMGVGVAMSIYFRLRADRAPKGGLQKQIEGLLPNEGPKRRHAGRGAKKTDNLMDDNDEDL